ncbi:MAG: peptide chain release factor N(5)-glutamine methyltransferase [Solirubrobacteraceae bacterium]
MSSMSLAAGAVCARDALDGAATAIGAGGSQSPRLDAELLLCDVLGVRRERLHTDPGLRVAGAAVREYQSRVRRRSVEREPVAYILGRQAFRRIELAVDARALIPRPESELLVEAAVELLPHGANVLDVGTGSGAIALALADERPDLRVTASDISADALELARENAARLGFVQRVRFHQADGVLAGGAWDAVVSNPPYIPAAQLPMLAVSRHEPAVALDGGSDGLAVARRIVEQTRAPLLALEVGLGQAGQVCELMERAGFRAPQTRRDLAGIERVVVGRRG